MGKEITTLVPSHGENTLFTVNKTSLTFTKKVTDEEWHSVFKSLTMAGGGVQWWLGDALAYREQRWGMYDDVIEESGFSKLSLKHYVWVAKSVKSCIRVHDLSFRHHMIVAPLPPKEQKYWLDKALEGTDGKPWTVRKLRDEIRKQRLLDAPPIPSGKYRIIYADPPWMYGQEQHSDQEQETVLESHYQTMTAEEIAAMPVREHVEDNAVLFLWTTSPKLFESKLVIDGWGFKYKSSMIWDKVDHNVGYYVSVRHEFLLICTRGSCLPDVKELVDSVYSEERTEHSKKPEYFIELIDKLYPHGKRLIMFTRKKYKGWDVHGDQICQ